MGEFQTIIYHGRNWPEKFDDERDEYLMAKIGRPVNLVSIGLTSDEQNLSKILSLIEQEGNEGVDLMVFPELALGYSIIDSTSNEIAKIQAMAAKKGVYIVFTAFRYGEREAVHNASWVIDRQGNIMGIYDKAFPYITDEHGDPDCVPGKDMMVFDMDFGKVGIANCFDANFPDAFKRLSDLGAELVVFPSGYSAGASLQAHAINHHYYIVSSTVVPDCLAYDITGQEIYYQKTPGLNISRLTLDLDRCIFHYDLNIKKRDRLLQDYADAIEMDNCLERESWFTLKAKKPGVSVQKLAADYELETLSHYKKRKSDELDGLRGYTLRSL